MDAAAWVVKAVGGFSGRQETLLSWMLHLCDREARRLQGRCEKQRVIMLGSLWTNALSVWISVPLMKLLSGSIVVGVVFVCSAENLGNYV